MMKSSRVAGGGEVAAERFDARRVTQIEAEDLQAVAHSREVGLLRVTRRRVTRKARRDDQVRAAAQQLQTGLVADLHAAAGEQRDAAAQVRKLRARREVFVAAGWTELIVEVMDLRVGRLADVADARGGMNADTRRLAFCVRRSGFVVRGSAVDVRRKDVRRRHERTAALRADAGRVERGFLVLDGVGSFGLVSPPLRARVGRRKGSDGAVQALAIGWRQDVEQAPISRDAFEPVDCRGARSALCRSHRRKRSRKLRWPAAPPADRRRWRGGPAAAWPRGRRHRGSARPRRRSADRER